MKHRVPIKMNPKRRTARHIIIKIAKVIDKKRIYLSIEKARERDFMYKKVPIRLSADFSTETLQVREDWQEIVKVNIDMKIK